jgi:uncharacterized membrane protein YhaH (DUF805 family)
MKALAYRTNRATYAVTMAAFVAIVALLVATVGRPGPTEVVAAFIVIPRLHDIGRSGWWYLPILVGSILIALVGIQMGGLEAAQIALGLYTLLVLALFGLLALIPGQPTANKWGEPPAPGISWKRPKTAEEKYKEIF